MEVVKDLVVREVVEGANARQGPELPEGHAKRPDVALARELVLKIEKWPAGLDVIDGLEGLNPPRSTPLVTRWIKSLTPLVTFRQFKLCKWEISSARADLGSKA